MQLQILEWLVNDRLETMCKEATVAWFEILSRNMPEETEKIHENLSQNSRYSDRELNW